MPSCRSIYFLDSEQLIVIQDGNANVFICSIEMQKRLFQDRVIKNKKQDEMKTLMNIEAQQQSAYLIGGMQITKKYRKTDDFDEVDYDVLKDTAGVKVIRFDEDIQRVFCSRNTGPFGYIAIVGNTKLSLYLAYAEEIVAVYDQVWTITQMDLKRNLVGQKI